MEIDWQNPILKGARLACVSTATLLLTGMATGPLVNPAWEKVGGAQPELNLGELEGALGQGVIVGMLGGFRTIAADFLWIKLNGYWEKRDQPATEALIRITTATDPRPLFYWQNGARMIAYDMPNWRLWNIDKRLANIPENVRDRINHEQAQRALALLERAKQFHPEEPKIVMEEAMLYLNKLDDPATAAALYKQASELPGAPFYASRIHAEILRNRLGRQHEAYDFYREHLKELSPDNPYAMRGVIIQRIRELEAELDIPEADRLPPQPEEAEAEQAAP